MESHSRRRLSGSVLGALAALSLWAVATAATGRVEQPGSFALLGGSPKIVSKFWPDHVQGLSATLKVRQFALDGKPILDYDVDMEHVMHMIVVRDDFATFAHVHPDFDTTTGTFWQTFTKDPGHRYYVYADTTPHGIGRQVFRFTLASSGPVAASAPDLRVSPATMAAGPYTVKLSKTTLRANHPKNLNLTILAGGKPAPDLGPYLGAAAHVVFINASTLEYAHVHPMVRGSASNSPGMEMHAGMGMSDEAGPFMAMAVPALPAGTYKVWIEFLGGGRLYTVPFTIRAR